MSCATWRQTSAMTRRPARAVRSVGLEEAALESRMQRLSRTRISRSICPNGICGRCICKMRDCCMQRVQTFVQHVKSHSAKTKTVSASCAKSSAPEHQRSRHTERDPVTELARSGSYSAAHKSDHQRRPATSKFAIQSDFASVCAAPASGSDQRGNAHHQ